MELPDKLKKAKKGKVVFSDSPSKNNGLSALGTKTLVLTDYPAAYIHDTGGLGAERVEKLERERLKLGDTCIAYWSDLPRKLRCLFYFDDIVSAEVVIRGSKAESVANQIVRKIRGPVPPGNVFATDVPVMIDYEFAETADGEDEAECDELEFLDNPLLVERKRPRGADVTLANGRLVIVPCGAPEPIAAPVDVFTLSRSGREFSLEGDVAAERKRLAKATFSFPSASMADKFERAFKRESGKRRPKKARDAETDRGFAGPASVTGILGGLRHSATDVDVLLRGRELLLRDAEKGNASHSFDLDSPKTGVGGTTASFVICDGAVGPVLIAPKSDALREHLLANPAMVGAATRSASRGPYLALVEEEPVRVGFEGRTVKFFGGFAKHVQSNHIQAVDVKSGDEASEVTLNSSLGSIQIRGGHEMLEAITAGIRAVTLAESAEPNVSHLASAVLGLEGDYFAYSLLGPIAELHLELRKEFSSGGADLSGEELGLREPQGEKEEATLLGLLATNIETLERHVDACMYTLPEFVVAQDEALFELAGQPVPDAVARQREAYVRAFTGLQPVVGQLVRLERELQRLDSVREALARAQPGIGGLATSFGLSFINPIALLGAAHQLVGFISSSTKAVEGESRTRSSTALMSRKTWNYLISQVLGPVAFRLMEAVYDQRQLVARTLVSRCAGANGAARQKLLWAVTLRFARLESFFRFPSGIAGARPRREGLKVLERCRGRVAVSAFRPF